MVSAQEIPDWVHNNAKWWSENKISDLEFTNAMKFLIDNEMIVIPLVTTSDVEKQETIPSWIKNSVKWWSQDQISDESFLRGLEFLVDAGIIQTSLPSEKTLLFSGDSPLFTKYAYKEDFRDVDGERVPIDSHLKLKSGLQEKYDEIGFFNELSNSVVIAPLFTSTAYWEPGFYTYYRNQCDTECLTKKIDFENPFGFSASAQGFEVFKLLNYHTISDFELAKNPNIINNYDKVIILHNEYVSKEMFDAITNHPKVIYLYPNALYAEIDVDIKEKTITLIRGHGYPENDISNGFNWKFENTHPYEFDKECETWEFYDIDNGVMLNCYPEDVIYTNFDLLKKIKDY